MMNDRSESLRQMIEMAISYGRKLQSSQTGYLHHCYGLHDEETHLPIPLVENFLFALALLRSRLIENVTEAKTMLDRLLHFQNRQSECQGDKIIAAGNFPVYVHEYPVCNDRFTGIHVACAIYWMLKLFHQVLGQELKKRLEEAFIAAVRHALKMQHEKPAGYALALKIAALAQAGGQLLQDVELVRQGQVLLEQLHAMPSPSAWYCPKSMGMILSALGLLYVRLSDSPWRSFWQHLGDTWHRRTMTYIGPAVKEWQQGYEPQVTLYDMFMGYLSGGFPDRVLKANPTHLEAMLVPVCDDILPEPVYPMVLEGVCDGMNWQLHHAEGMAYTIIESNTLEINPAVEKSFHPFRLVWGGRQRVHTFVCQGGNSKIIGCRAGQHELCLSFALGDTVEVEEREKSRDVIFFMDTQEDVEFLVNGHKSSTFRLGDSLSICDAACHLGLTFTLEAGEGRFFGHRMLGNRPAQLDTKGSRRYQVYDWQVFVRTLGRSPNCRLNVLLQMAENSRPENASHEA